MIKTLSWDDYVRLSFEEIRNGAAASVQVTRRLRACFEDLLQCAPEERRAPLERQLRLLDAEIESNGAASRIPLSGGRVTRRASVPRALPR